MSTATLSETPEPIVKRSDERKIARQRALLLIGHEGVMLDKIQQQAAHVLNVAKRAAGITTSEEQPEAPEEESEMGVNIGNETHNHFQIELQDQPTAAAPVVVDKPAIHAPVAATTAAVAPMNPLLAAAIGGGLVLCGGLLNSWWNGPDVSPPAAQAEDVNWGLGVEVRPHKE